MEKQDIKVIKNYLDRVLTLLGRLLSYEKEYEDDSIKVISQTSPIFEGTANKNIITAKTEIILKMSGDEYDEDIEGVLVFQTKYGKVLEFRPGEWIAYLEELLEYELPLEECMPINDYDFFMSDEEECEE